MHDVFEVTDVFEATRLFTLETIVRIYGVQEGGDV